MDLIITKPSYAKKVNALIGLALAVARFCAQFLCMCVCVREREIERKIMEIERGRKKYNDGGS